MKLLNGSKKRLVIIGFVMAMILLDDKRVKADFIFGEPVNLGTPINTSSWEWTLVISPDNLQMYVNSDRPGGLGYFDIWRSTREHLDDPWDSLVNVQEINSQYNESFPCFSASGLTLYYSDWYTWNTAGDRAGGIGGHDLWKRTRLSTDDPWGPAVNMGVTVNSSGAEVAPSVSQDGQILIFSSNRSGGRGDYDLWMSTRPDVESDWGAPVNLGPVVNSSAYDAETWLSPDGLALFFSSSRPGGMGSYDLYLTTRWSRDAAWSPPVNLGPAINTGSGEGAPSVSPDLKTLYFASNRPGGLGNWDIYEVSITPIVDFNGDERVDIQDLLRLIESWGQDDHMVDIGPAPWGDGVVDAPDLEVLMSHWGQEIPSPFLVAHWKLDEAEGDVAYDSAGENDATVVGNPLWRPEGGRVSGAIQLDGVDDYVSTDFVLNPADGPFSVFAWIQGGSPGDVVMSQIDGIGGSGETWLGTEPSSGKFMSGLVPPAAGRFIPQPLKSQSVITDGQWHHIGFVWDGSYRSLYVDGVEVAKDEAALGKLKYSNGGLYFGAGKTLDATSFFSGLIDDVRIYDVALSADKIEALAQ